MGKHTLSAVSGALVAGVAVVAMVFFWQNPFRVGEITVATPHGPSVSFKVANSNEISELIRKGLENEHSTDHLTNALLSIIEHLPPGSRLGEKLVELAEQRRPPFLWSSVPVKLVYDRNMRPGLAAVCENSGFAAKNITVFVLSNDGDMLHTFQAYADATLVFPCPGGGETLRLNSTDFEAFNHYKVLAKRAL